jgi:hypothetical protein
MAKAPKEKVLDTTGIPLIPVIAGSPEDAKLADQYKIVTGRQTGFKTSSILGVNFYPSLSSTLEEEDLSADVPHLADIELITNTTYQDDAGQTRAKLVFKIRNSSKNEVDSVVYQIGLSAKQGGLS